VLVDNKSGDRMTAGGLTAVNGQEIYKNKVEREMEK
jgi:hypothetical protein